MQRQKMPVIGHNPRMRIVGNGTFWLRAAILAILCTVAFAANAYADEAGAPQAAPETGEAQGQPPPAEGQNPGSEGSAKGTESPGGGTVAVGEGTEQAGGEQTGGVTGGGGESVEAPPPATEPTSESGVVAVEQGPVEAAKDGPLAGAGEEAPGTASLEAVRADSSDPGGAQGVRAAGAGEAGEESQAIVAGPLTVPPTAPTAGATEAQASTTPAPPGNDKRVGLTAAQHAAGSLSCELSDLGGRTTDNCTVGWLGGKRFVESSSVNFSPVAGSLAAAATGGVPPDGGHGGGSSMGNAPASPSPGPAPGGASGAAVGGGGIGGGGAPSAFLSLAGLLLLAGPRALRRLRLSSRPWLTACFVLIPERPG
jgi:hypothetical protein